MSAHREAIPPPPLEAFAEEEVTRVERAIPVTPEEVGRTLIALLEQGEANAVEISKVADRVAAVERVVAESLGAINTTLQHLADGISTALERANIATRATEEHGHRLALLQGGQPGAAE